MPKLTELHLGETPITNLGIQEISKFTQLKKLWLHDTQITDKSVSDLANLRNLKSLYLYKSKISIDGVKKLQRQLPRCEIFFRSENTAE